MGIILMHPRLASLLNHLMNMLLMKSFAGSGTTISTKGNRHLRAALGSRTFVEEFVSKKVATWITDVKQLAKIAHTQPQAAYAAYIHGLSSRWLFLLHTVPDMQDLLQPLED